MKSSWWKVPLYCMAASWICFQLEILWLGQWAIVTLPDGSITSDTTRWMILSAGLFLAVVLIGGLLFFRKMSRKEILFSASVLAFLNVVLGLLANLIQHSLPYLTVFWAELTEWSRIFSQILSQLGANPWVSAFLVWLLPPYIFLLFGKKETNNR